MLQQFLPKVIEYSADAQIWIIDNASSDDSVSWVEQNYSNISVITLGQNSGFAGGYQKGLAQITSTYYCLLNSDVEVTKDWLLPLKKIFEENPNIAAVQPKILDFKRKEYFEYAGAAGGFMDRFGYPYCRGRIFDSVEKDCNQYDDECEIFWASGACLFVRSSAYWEVGGLDEDYFAHQEEIDLCWRMYNSGYQIWYTSNSKVYHVGGASLNYQSPQKTYLNFRNSLYSLVKNEYGKRSVFVIFLRMLLDGLAACQFLFQGKLKHFKAILKAHFAFYKHLPKLIRKRNQLKQQKRFPKAKSIVFDYFVRKKRVF